MNLPENTQNVLSEALGRCGLRSTRQREHVFAVLLGKRDHPTADEVYSRAKKTMPTISLATVYNCLETLIECQLVRQVNWERESTRYCPNLTEHAHFHCENTGEVVDIKIPENLLSELKGVVSGGFQVDNVEIAFRGTKKTGQRN